MGYNNFVQDEEYEQNNTNVCVRTKHIEETLNAMLETMRNVVGLDGALQGNVAENFSTFIDTVALLQGKVEALGVSYDKLTTSFLAQIDETDQDIY